MLRITVTNKSERLEIQHEAGPIEFGRAPTNSEVPRCVVQDLAVSRNHLRVMPLPAGKSRVENLTENNTVHLSDNRVLGSRGRADVDLPTRLGIGDTIIEAASVEEVPDTRFLDSLAEPPIRPSLRSVRKNLDSLGSTPEADQLVRWFETVLSIQRAAAGSEAFFTETAEAVVDLIRMDKALVLLRRGERWEVAARVAVREEGFSRDFSTAVLARVLEEKRTFFQTEPTTMEAESLRGIEAVVASPIFDASDTIVGMIYASRNRYQQGRGVGVAKIEAQLVQVLAATVGAGLARREQEASAARLRARFDQFFSPALARELERNPKILEGQQRVVSVLFSDIRGFSRLSERLDPEQVCRLVADVMDGLTAHVRATDGVVVDYYGDGMCAMWNAPLDQHDHAARACRCALAALQDLPVLSAKWQPLLGQPLSMGMGLNTGTALVGNTGSQHKFKYGPFGHTVNLASRVEGATKALGMSALLTGSTQALLNGTFATRRLCKARLAGMTEAIDLFELQPGSASAEWLRQRDVYENALRRFENGEWKACCAALLPVLSTGADHHDVPSLNLLSRAMDCLLKRPTDFSPVWEFSGK